MTQPEALRLANYLESKYDLFPRSEQMQAVSELRRLHEDNENTLKHFNDAVEAYKVMSAQRDELLEALKEIVDAADGTGWDQLDASFSKARAAIAKAEEKL